MIAKSGAVFSAETTGALSAKSGSTEQAGK
jgi:hypothetical protein